VVGGRAKAGASRSPARTDQLSRLSEPTVFQFRAGKTLREAGAIFADTLPPQKARILSMLALRTTAKADQMQKLFDR
jgi:L-asparaginase/Glu-tRNA(Gln) amidotransferase subunit D